MMNYPHEQGGCVYSYFQDMKIDKGNLQEEKKHDT